MSIFQEIWESSSTIGSIKMACEGANDNKKSEMLHAQDNHAFRMAVGNGHLKIVKWLFD